MSPDELLSSHVVPVNGRQASSCGAPRLSTTKASDRSKVRMAGNAMNVPSVGAFLMAAMMMFEPVA